MAADLAQNLFLRELAKRDLEKKQKSLDDAAAAESLGQALDAGSKARDASFKRNLETAKLAGEHAATLGEQRPEFESAAVDEGAASGFEGGRAKQRLAEEDFDRKKANELFRSELMGLRDEKKAGLDTERGLQLEEKRDESRKGIAELNRTSIEKEGARNRALQEKLFGMRNSPSNLTKGALGREQTKEGKAKQRLSDIRSIRETFKDEKGLVNYYKFLSPQAKNRADELERKAERGDMTPEERTEYQQHAKVRAAVGILRAEIYRENIGAGQTESEAARQADSVVQYMHDPDVFKSVLDSIEDRAGREVQTSRIQMGHLDTETDPYSYEEAPPPAPGDVSGAEGFWGGMLRKIKKMGKQVPIAGPGITTHE